MVNKLYTKTRKRRGNLEQSSQNGFHHVFQHFVLWGSDNCELQEKKTCARKVEPALNILLPRRHHTFLALLSIHPPKQAFLRSRQSHLYRCEALDRECSHGSGKTKIHLLKFFCRKLKQNEYRRGCMIP